MSTHSGPPTSDSPEPQGVCSRPCRGLPPAVATTRTQVQQLLSEAGALSSTQKRCSLKSELNVNYPKLLIACSMTVQRETKILFTNKQVLHVCSLKNMI